MDSVLFVFMIVAVTTAVLLATSCAVRAYRKVVRRDSAQYLVAEQDLFRKKVTELKEKADENVRSSRRVQERTYELVERINFLASVRGVNQDGASPKSEED